MLENNLDQNRRENKRCSTKHETLVYNEDFFGQLVDISEGGLAFAYPKNQARPKDMFFNLNVFCNNNDLHIKNLRCKIVSEINLPQHLVEADETIRRQGIEFGKLSEEQRLLLTQLINHSDSYQATNDLTT